MHLVIMWSTFRYLISIICFCICVMLFIDLLTSRFLNLSTPLLGKEMLERFGLRPNIDRPMLKLVTNFIKLENLKTI